MGRRRSIISYPSDSKERLLRQMTPMWAEWKDYPYGVRCPLPDNLDRVVDLDISDEIDYINLVNYCAIHSYWFYVVQEPQVSNEEFDCVKTFIRDLEYKLSTEGRRIPQHKLPHLPNGYSPTIMGYNPLRYLSCRYPEWIQMAFKETPIHPRYPESIIRLQAMKSRKARKMFTIA